VQKSERAHNSFNQYLAISAIYRFQVKAFPKKLQSGSQPKAQGEALGMGQVV
jgi:hypothetical protein